MVFLRHMQQHILQLCIEEIKRLPAKSVKLSRFCYTSGERQETPFTINKTLISELFRQKTKFTTPSIMLAETSNFKLESAPKSTNGCHCEEERRSNLLVFNVVRLLRYARNDEKTLFGVDSNMKRQTSNIELQTSNLFIFDP